MQAADSDSEDDGAASAVALLDVGTLGVDAGVQDVALLEGCSQRAVQAVLEVELAVPLDHVGEQVAVEGGVLAEEAVQGQNGRGGEQFVEPDLPRRDLRPVAIAQAVLGVGLAVLDALENHSATLVALGRLGC